MAVRPPARPLALLLLAGCVVGPEYARPELPVPEAWRDGSAEAATLADTAWWELLGDPALRELIDEALRNNLDARTALERVVEARALVAFTRADQGPFADLFAGADKGAASRDGRPPVPTGSNGTELYGAGLDLSWELDLFGRLQRATQAEELRLLASEELRRDVQITLISEVARAWFDLRQLQLSLDISRRTVLANLRTEELTRVRFEGGVASELDWRQAQSERYRTEAVVANLQRLHARTENELSVLLGRPPHVVRRGLGLADQPVPPAVPAGLPSALLERRPDLRAAELRLAAATARIGEAQAILFPRVALTGSGGWASTELSDLTDSDADFWGLALDLTWPLFNGGKLQAGVEVAQAQQRQAALAYEQAVLRALQEVEDALADLRSFGEQRVLQDARAEAERELLRLSVLRYEGGVASYLEVLVAQRSQLTAELERAQAWRDQLVALVRLYKALGGGWDLQEPGAAHRR